MIPFKQFNVVGVYAVASMVMQSFCITWLYYIGSLLLAFSNLHYHV